MDDDIARDDTVYWPAVEEYSRRALRNLLLQRGLIVVSNDDTSNSSSLSVNEGSLWDESQLKDLALVWHRLTPWPDTCRGLELLNKRFTTTTLSNTYNELLQELVAYGKMPFQHVYSADMFQSYKPDPKVYLGAAAKMDVKPEECALVAAHLNDLKAAKACGFQAIYVQRPSEEKTPELKKENIIPDLVVEEDEGGFVALAGRLGISEC